MGSVFSSSKEEGELRMACVQGNNVVAKKLIEDGVSGVKASQVCLKRNSLWVSGFITYDILQDDVGISALMITAQGGNIEILSLLIQKHKKDLNQQNKVYLDSLFRCYSTVRQIMDAMSYIL